MDQRTVRVLLVDDSQTEYALTRHLLSKARRTRYEVDWVATYDQGLAIIKETRHDVYLLDHRLGKRTGLELLREVLAGGCTAPFIIFTGEGDLEVDLEFIRAGACDYLDKTQLTAVLLDRSLRYAIERKRTTDNLRELQKAVESMQTGLIITDLQNHIAFVNPAAARMHGYRAAELAGEDSDRLCAVPERPGGGGIEPLKWIKGWRRDGVRRRKDGTSFPAELVTDVVSDVNGQPIALVTVCEDVSERRRVELAARESEERYRTLVDTAADVIFTIGPEGMLLSLNPAFEAVTGWPRESWIGKSYSGLLHPDEREASAQGLQEIWDHGGALKVERRVLTRTGLWIHVEYTATRLQRDGAAVALIGVARDVTARTSAAGNGRSWPIA
jgi:PAS domain S-box-containing protein